MWCVCVAEEKDFVSCGDLTEDPNQQQRDQDRCVEFLGLLCHWIKFRLRCKIPV